MQPSTPDNEQEFIRIEEGVLPDDDPAFCEVEEIPLDPADPAAPERIDGPQESAPTVEIPVIEPHKTIVSG